MDAPESAAEKEADHTADKVVQRSSLLDTPRETFFPLALQVQRNPEAEMPMMGIVGKIQLLREQAATLKEGTDQEKINAEMMRSDIQMMYHGVYTSDEWYP